ncbi:MAG: DUF4442 domain-containing protein [Aureispira sp.]
MSVYQQLATVGSKLFKRSTIFKYGFNLSPMYRRSTAQITEVSEDLLNIRIKLPLSYKNKNYVSSIFGGSMFAAVDPIPMVQLMNLIGDDFVVWDKSAEVFFKRPAREDLYAQFTYTSEELADIQQQVTQQQEIDIVKTTQLTNKDGSVVFCEVQKTIYVANKAFYKEKKRKRR